MSNRITKEHPDKIEALKEIICSQMEAHKKNISNIVVVCIGTDRCTGDALGPIIGTKLAQRKDLKGLVDVYGTLEFPVHALTIEETINMIDEDNSFVIAIDSSIGREAEDIVVETGCIFPGSGVGKELPSIGDIAIKGVMVSNKEYKFSRQIALTNVRLFIVYEMAKIVEEALYESILKALEEKGE